MDIYDLPSDDDGPISKEESETESDQEEGQEGDDAELPGTLKREPEVNLKEEEEEEEGKSYKILQPKTRRPYDSDDNSIGSAYSPSPSSDEEGSGVDGELGLSTSTSKRGGSRNHVHDYELPPEPQLVTLRQQRYQPQLRSPQKRLRQDSSTGGIVDRISHDHSTANGGRPVKRIKASFNHQYLDLLNRDIQNTALLQPVFGGGGELRSSSASSSSSSLSKSSQIGLSIWTDSEKDSFFEALSRAGGGGGGLYSAPAVASRIKTKNQFEVAQYLHLLESSTNLRKHEKHDLEPISPMEIPAAVEISQACCDALEGAAIALSSRQETYEEDVERRRWGESYWLITRDNIASIEEEQQQQDEDHLSSPSTTSSSYSSSSSSSPRPKLLSSSPPARPPLKSLQLFMVKNWLELSERIFMNTASPMEDNWVSVVSDEEEERGSQRPGVRATALEDFYSIAVSLTRRIVAATAYISRARTMAKRGLRAREIKGVVRKQDVEAAVASLGLRGGRKYASWEEFWVGAARRLRLDVYEEDLPLPSGGDEKEGRDGASDRRSRPISYKAVEEALRAGEKRENIPTKQEEEEKKNQSDGLRIDPREMGYHQHDYVEDVGDTNQTEASEDEQQRQEEAMSSSPARPTSLISETEGDDLKGTQGEYEREQVENEVDEFVTAARPFVVIPDNIKKLMRRRVRAARGQELFADQLDRKASIEEERRLWALLGKGSGTGADPVQIDGDGDGDGYDSAEDSRHVKIQEVEDESRRYTLPRTGKGTVEELYEYYCGDDAGFEGGVRGQGEEDDDGGQWRLVEVGRNDISLEGGYEGDEESASRGRSHHSSKSDLAGVSTWELDWMNEKKKKRNGSDREPEMLR